MPDSANHFATLAGSIRANREQALKTLAELDGQRAALIAMISQMDSQIATAEAHARGAGVPNSSGERLTGRSLAQVLYETIASRPGYRWAPDELQRALGPSAKVRYLVAVLNSTHKATGRREIILHGTKKGRRYYIAAIGKAK